MLYLTITGAMLVILVSLRLRHSRLGRAWKAMSSDEDIAQAMGINLVNIKLLAFSIGASFAGFAGMIFASRQTSIFPNDFSLDVSINVLALVIIGGMGSIPGVVVGAIALIGLPELLRPIESYRILTFGLLLIVSMIALPRGLMPSPPPALEEEARRLAEAEDHAKEAHS
jgi:branched-chain amino acid transport system permease protein